MKIFKNFLNRFLKEKNPPKETNATMVVEKEVVEEEGLERANDFVKKLLKVNLNNKNVFLIDFENTHSIPSLIYKEKTNVVFVFVGNKQRQTFEEYMKGISCLARVYDVHAERTGSNFLDNKLSLYAGMMIGMYSPKSMTIVSNDRDFSLLHTTLAESPIEFKQMLPNLTRDVDLMFEPDKAYLDRVQETLRLKFAKNAVKKKTIRGEISKSKIEKLSPEMVDEIFDKLVKTKRITYIRSGRYQGRYTIN